MAQELNSIIGKIEYLSQLETSTVGHKDGILSISSFYGGEERGRCLQISIEDTHIQLNREQAYQLQNQIAAWLFDTRHPKINF